jgi:hypothetical protein
MPMPIDTKHTLSGKYDVALRNTICFELASLHNKRTFRMDNLPQGRNAVGSKWVVKVKVKPDGSIDRFKARVVAWGLN